MSLLGDSKARRKQRTATYVNLRAHREELGWSIAELLGKLQGSAVSEKSVRRLEDGRAIRVASVNKIFNAISAHYPNELIRCAHVTVV
jgi:ribosome-binding protein aMBF1 (putative translation factor)